MCFRSTTSWVADRRGITDDEAPSVLTTERYYCRARADLAYARVNEAYNHAFKREPAINGETV